MIIVDQQVTMPLAVLQENRITILQTLPSRPKCQQPSCWYETQNMSKHVENSLAAKQQIMDTSFTELLPTPKIKTSANPRRKAINSSAVIVTKDLFGPKMKCNPSPMPKERSIKTKRPGGSENGKSRVQKESWYCFVCNTDTVLDMRRWAACGNYVHEECVDLTKDDTQSFLCPRCSS